MAPNQDLFTEIKKFNKRVETPTEATGKVISVAKPIAMVKLNGSNQFQEAWYDSGTVIAPGNDVTLVRNGRNPRWVITGAFGTNVGGSVDEAGPAGNSGITGPAGSNGTDATVGNLYTIVDGTSLSLSNGVLTTLKTLLITPEASTKVLIGCNMSFEPTANTFYLCNAGIEFSSTFRICSSVVTVRDSGWPMNGRWPAPFTTFLTGLTVGVQNTVYIRAQVFDLVGSNTSKYFVWDTWVLEI